MDFGSDLSSLMLELIHRVTRVVPEKVICPAAGFAFGIYIGSAKEERLNDEVLQSEFSFLNSVVNPLMAGIEAARVASHRGETGFLCDLQNHFRVCQIIRNRNFHLNVLACPHHLYRLFRVHLRG
jgi:hypothetical protein